MGKSYLILKDDILKLKDDMKLKEVILKLKDDVKPKEEYGLKLEEIAGLFEGVDSGRLKMFQILTRVDKEIIDKNCEDIKNIEDSLENLNHR
ncbi:20788_t:CDS:2 [Rhizophagus irregularis]|nr:20788_t:CDS:2 [Rhizophagus irregularis]